MFQHCPRQYGNVSISTSKNKKGYKTRSSTRNDMAHVNEMSSSITDPSSSITSHSGPGACVRRSTRRYPTRSIINQNFHSGSTSMAQGTEYTICQKAHASKTKQ